VENNIPIRGFQFEMTLPDGVTVIDWSLSEGRLPEGLSPTDKMDMPDSNGSNFIWPCALNKGSQMVYFTGNSGEIATITIQADASVVGGSYSVEVKDIHLSDPYGHPDFNLEDDAFELTILSFAEGYAVEVLPFALNEEYVDVPILMDNETDVKSFSFDLFIPSSFVSEEVYDGFVFAISGFNTSSSEVPTSEGAIHVTAERRRQNKIAAGEGTEIATLQLYYENDIVPAGVYPITIKNIALTNTSDESFMAAPYTTEIFVGDDPKIVPTDGVAAFHGNYGGADEFALLYNALPEGATIDLTEVSAMAEDPTTLRTDNVIVTTENVSYGRSMTNAWGSLCLPFAVESDENIQLYELKSVSESAMTFDPVASVEANMPVIFKTLGDGFTAVIANDAFDLGFATATPTTSVEAIANWDLNGTYITETIDVSGIQAYGLMNNEFHRFTKSLTAGAFRAWLQNNGAPMNATIRIEDSTEGISIVEQEDGSVKLIFDMQGRQLKDAERSQMYIENGKKKFNK